jgi:glutathione S-transferase
MRLYHHPMSFNARRAVMTALHLGADVELVFVDLAKGAQRAPEFLALNVAGKVPVLVDDGFALPESHAIMQYLADKTPGQTVYPSDPKERATVDRWLFWSAQQMSPAAGLLNWERNVKGFLGQGAPDPGVVKRGEGLFADAARTLEAHLAKRDWIVGDRLTLADLAVATPLMAKDSASLPLADAPRVLAWFDRIRALDAWKKTEPPPRG